MSKQIGMWRSLVAHLHGVQGVASSNLVIPTNGKGFQETGSLFCFIPGSESRKAGGSQVRILSSRLNQDKGFRVFWNPFSLPRFTYGLHK